MDVTRRDFLRLSAALATMTPMPGNAGVGGEPDYRWLDARLQDRVALGYFDGMGVIIGREETVLHEAYFGSSHATTVLHVASVGKWTAAATIAALVDEHVLEWDDPVKKFLPEFSDIKGEATLRQLLSHTSGYPDYQPEGRPRDSYATLCESVAHIAGLPAVAAPGQVFRYGGLAMQVAGRMAEIATGDTFETLFQSRLAKPLSMTRSGYTPVSQEQGFSPMLGGSLFTSTGDFSRFLMMLAQTGRFQGAQVLSHSAVTQMRRDQIRGARVTPMEFVEEARADRRQDVYGLGEWREEIGVDGDATLISSPGWAGAYAWIDRAYDIWGIVLAKANVDVAMADGYSTFLGSSIYAPMVRTALEESRESSIRRGRIGPVYYEEKGRGDPIIFLHDHLCDRRQWNSQFHTFSNRYRVIRYDLRGYGRSQAPESGAHALHAKDLHLLMEGLNIHRAHLVGLGLGGCVATDFVILWPHRVRSVTLAGIDLFEGAGSEPPRRLAEDRQRVDEIEVAKQKGWFAWKRECFNALIEKSGSGADTLRIPLWRMIDECPGPQVSTLQPHMLLGRATRRHLAKDPRAAPALIIRGDREAARSVWDEMLRHSRVRIIPDCGPISNMECPTVFSNLLSAFLDSIG